MGTRGLQPYHPALSSHKPSGYPGQAAYGRRWREPWQPDGFMIGWANKTTCAVRPRRTSAQRRDLREFRKTLETQGLRAYNLFSATIHPAIRID